MIILPYSSPFPGCQNASHKKGVSSSGGSSATPRKLSEKPRSGEFGNRFAPDAGYVDVDTRVSRESYGAAKMAAGAVILAVGGAGHQAFRRNFFSFSVQQLADYDSRIRHVLCFCYGMYGLYVGCNGFFFSWIRRHCYLKGFRRYCCCTMCMGWIFSIFSCRPRIHFETDILTYLDMDILQ